MGQKVNPVGMRVGINRDWNSRWYANDREYHVFLNEDIKIRKYLEKNLKDALLSHVEIERTKNDKGYGLVISVFVARPGVVIGTNGENIEISCTMKPIPSLARPLKSVNVHTKKIEKAEAVRSDVCAVPAAGVVAEAAVAFELARAMVEKFGADCMEDMKNNYKSYVSRIQIL